MHINIPLLPISADVRIRRLPPFRVSLLRLMIAVAFFGLFFGLMAQLKHLRQESLHHYEKVLEAGPNYASPAARWHEAQKAALNASHERIEVLLLMMTLPSMFLGAVAVLGRVLDLLLRRPSPTPNLNLNSEGFQP